MRISRRRKPRRAAKDPSIKRDRAPRWWDAHTTRDPITFAIRRACGIATTTVSVARRTRSAAVAAGQETLLARIFRSCGTSAAAEMRSIPYRVKSAGSSRHWTPIIKMNLRNRSSGTGCLCLSIVIFSANELAIVTYNAVLVTEDHRWPVRSVHFFMSAIIMAILYSLSRYCVSHLQALWKNEKWTGRIGHRWSSVTKTALYVTILILKSIS